MQAASNSVISDAGIPSADGGGAGGGATVATTVTSSWPYGEEPLSTTSSLAHLPLGSVLRLLRRCEASLAFPLAVLQQPHLEARFHSLPPYVASHPVVEGCFSLFGGGTQGGVSEKSANDKNPDGEPVPQISATNFSREGRRQGRLCSFSFLYLLLPESAA